MNILITGGTGFLGSALTRHFLAQGARVTLLSRDPQKAKHQFGAVAAISNLNDLNEDAVFQVIINLAGAPIFEVRWSNTRKKLLRDSRIELTRQLVTTIARMNTKPDVFISGSAIGYYGEQGDEVLTEQSIPKPDFSQQLCADWEAAARPAEPYGVRVCIIRTGLVLAHDGGLLERMLPPFKLGLGGRLGNGKQWMSWIHRNDWLAIVQAMIDNNAMIGAYNATAPKPASNNEFTQMLAHALKRPALLPVPDWLLKLVLGEMASLVLGSQRVIPERLLSMGYVFKFPELTNAIDDVFKSKNAQ